MPLPWIKMWLEALDDPKVNRLSLAERGAWWGLLQLAGKCEADGKIVTGGAGLDIDEIADALHIKEDDRHVLESMIAKMKERGSLKWNQNTLTVVHFEERQRVPPSSRPENIAERVRRFRDKRKSEQKDPGKFVKGKYGHMVARSGADVKRLKEMAKQKETKVNED